MKKARLQTTFKGLWSAIAIVVIIMGAGGGRVFAATNDCPDGMSALDCDALLGSQDTDWVPGGATCTGGSDTGSISSGTLPSIIPEPYNGAFTNGANKHKVAPALIAALFTEENFTGTPTSGVAQRWADFPKQHPDPNSGWPTNQYNTEGAFQFIPSTWATYGDDGDGDGSKDPQHIADGAAAAANYVAANGATANVPPADWHNAIFAYNHAEWYVDAVMMYYNFYNSGQSTTTPPPAPTQPTSSCSSGSANVNCDNSGNAASDTSNVRQQVVCLAKNELSLWTSGKMKPGTDFHKYSQGADENWCADFVSYIYNEAGYPIGSGSAWRVPAVQGVMDIGQQEQKFHWHAAGTYTPKPGDLIIHKTGESHVNMVVEVNVSGNGASMTIIGGNQNTYDIHTSKVSQYTDPGFVGVDGITGYVSPDK